MCLYLHNYNLQNYLLTHSLFFLFTIAYKL
jgi:hypothetical protein